MKIGIIVAMQKEFDQLRSILDNSVLEHRNHKDFVKGRIGQHEIVLQQCGIGKVNSAIGAVEMIHYCQPDLIISSGCAGGADCSLNVLDVVVATQCVYHDAYCGTNVAYGQIMGMPEQYPTDSRYIQAALGLQQNNPQLRIKAGLTVSGEWFVDSQEKMRSILEHFPQATAVDMESCSIAQVCHVYNIPFVSFRIISDVPLKDTNASQYFDFWDRITNGSFAVTRSFIENLAS